MSIFRIFGDFECQKSFPPDIVPFLPKYGHFLDHFPLWILSNVIECAGMYFFFASGLPCGWVGADPSGPLSFCCAAVFLGPVASQLYCSAVLLPTHTTAEGRLPAGAGR